MCEGLKLSWKMNERKQPVPRGKKRAYHYWLRLIKKCGLSSHNNNNNNNNNNSNYRNVACLCVGWLWLISLDWCDTALPYPAAEHSDGLQCPRCVQLAVSGLVWLVSEPLCLRWPAASASPAALSDAPPLLSVGWLLAPGSEPMGGTQPRITAGIITCTSHFCSSISDNSQTDCDQNKPLSAQWAGCSQLLCCGAVLVNELLLTPGF